MPGIAERRVGASAAAGPHARRVVRGVAARERCEVDIVGSQTVSLVTGPSRLLDDRAGHGQG